MVYNLDSFSVIVVRARLAQSVEHQTLFKSPTGRVCVLLSFLVTCRLTLSTKLYIIGVTYDIWRRGLVG